MCAKTVTCGFDDIIFGGKLVGILKMLASAFASRIVEFCDDETLRLVPASPLFSVYNIHKHTNTA